LYKRPDGLWEGRVDIPPAPDGKRRTRSIYSKDRSTAAEKLRKLQAEVDVGLVTAGPATTLGEWLDYWLNEVHRSSIKPGTREDYSRIIKNHIRPRIGSKKLTKLLPEDVLAMQKGIAETSTRTAQIAHHIINRAFNDAVQWERCTRNPAAVVPTPKHVKEKRDPFTVAQVHAILDAARKVDDEDTGPVLTTRWAAAFLTGARKGELLGLTWDRVDLKNGIIDLEWQLQQLPQKHGCGDMQIGGTPLWPCGKTRAAYCPHKEFDVDPGDEYIVCHKGLAWTRPKSAAGKRVVPLAGDLPRRLQAHQDATCDQPNPHSLVWRHRDGRPISHKDDHEAWQALLVAAGIRDADGPTIAQHRTRHTTATVLLDAGVDAHIINTVIGHSDVTVTRGYQAVDLTLARRAFENLSGLLV
jgi:integrase